MTNLYLDDLSVDSDYNTPPHVTNLSNTVVESRYEHDPKRSPRSIKSYNSSSTLSQVHLVQCMLASQLEDTMAMDDHLLDLYQCLQDHVAQTGFNVGTNMTFPQLVAFVHSYSHQPSSPGATTDSDSNDS